MSLKTFDQMSDEDLEDLLDSGELTPAMAKKVEHLLNKREHPEHTQAREEREEEEA